jgi:hypothetical protein
MHSTLVILGPIGNHLTSILAYKAKGDAPVATHLYGPVAWPVTCQWVQIQTGKVHILRSFRGVQWSQDEPKPLGMLCLETRPSIRSEEAFQLLVLEFD